MKKYSSLICLLIIMLCFFSCKKDHNESTDYTFRKTTWGMSKADVKNSESSTYLYAFSNDSVLAFQSEQNPGEYYFYVFNNSGKLAQVYRQFMWSHSSNYNLYFNDYDSIKSELTVKYGTPVFDTIAWNDDSLKPYKDKWGQALMEGNLGYATGWENSTSLIYLQMMSVDGYFEFGVLYAPLFSKKKSGSLYKESAYFKPIHLVK